MPDPFSYAKDSEHSHQAALFMWANMARYRGLAAANDPLSYTKAGHAATYPQQPVPQLKWLHAIPNQGNTAGEAGRIHGARKKAEGLKAGVSDIFLPWPVTRPGAFNGAFPASVKHGLYIELKPDAKAAVKPEQLEFQADVTKLGYECHIARGWLEARQIILQYLGLTA